MPIMGIGVCHPSNAAPDVASAIDILSIGPRIAPFWHELPLRLLIPTTTARLKGRGTQGAENATVARKGEQIEALHTRRGPSPCACSFASARLDKGQAFHLKNRIYTSQ